MEDLYGLQNALQEAEEWMQLEITRRRQAMSIVEKLVSEYYVKFADVRQVRKLAEIATKHAGIAISSKEISQVAAKLGLQGQKGDRSGTESD